MKRSRISFTLVIFSTILFSEMIIHGGAKLEHLPEDIEEESIIKNIDYENVGEIIVDQNDKNAKYSNIQQAINAADAGATIYVKSGTYFEILNIDKKISLIGENKENTTICALPPP